MPLDVSSPGPPKKKLKKKNYLRFSNETFNLLHRSDISIKKLLIKLIPYFTGLPSQFFLLVQLKSIANVEEGIFSKSAMTVSNELILVWFYKCLKFKEFQKYYV